MDLRFLNEKIAGEHGLIAVKDGRFVHSANGRPVRFWAVNGPGREAKDRAGMRRTARMLAKYGVNLVRRHGAVFDKEGELDPAAVRRAIAIVEEMKAEGIYTLLSIYFPLWFTPRAGHPWMEGYDGKTHPFASLMFNPRFQEKYRGWWKALLLTPSETTGRALIQEPALMGVEVQNEDSFFFWTFNADRIPDAQMRILEEQFGEWLARKYGSIDAAFEAWKGLKVKRDVPAEGRISFRPLWDIFNEKTARDRDTVAFLFEVQAKFYRDTIAFLRSLGHKGLIAASNWATASPEVFGPLEKFSYTEGDFIDRHGYFDCNHKGDEAAWSIRNGHTYSDRSALRFEAEDPAKPRLFVHPVMDPHYDRKPSMISETTFCRPNRYRSEAPLYFAAYGALQASDAIVHFALDSDRWAVKPGQRIDPLIHFAGRVEVSFVKGPGSTKLADLAPFVDHAKKTVASSTGELKLDYGKGVLAIDAPCAQGVSGALKAAGTTELKGLIVTSDLDLGHIIAVSLDGRPLASSNRILLQVMSEEEETNHRVEQVSAAVKRIVSIGTDPWRVKKLMGTVRFKRADAAKLAVTALDFNGYPAGPAGTAKEITLLPSTMYYFISAAQVAPRS